MLPRRRLRVSGEVGLGVVLPVGADVRASGGVVFGDGDRRRGRRVRGGPGGARRRLRNGLTGQRGVGIALPVVSVVQRHVILVAFTHLDRRRSLARASLAGQVAQTAYGKCGVLWHPAVDITGNAVGVVHGGRRPLLSRRQEAGGAGWRQVEIEVEG